jgi:hypothetical protein
MRQAFYLSVLTVGVTVSFLVPASAGAFYQEGPPQSTYPWCDFEWYCDNDDSGALLDEGPSRPNQDLPDRERPDRDRPDRDRGGRG